mmetsp:Transcript_42419/g.68854  ORF Transcript_42419/g.68854 Transcript_42419/m.68854 type:complete len:322 (-) Transcript_42419:274-1239(-)
MAHSDDHAAVAFVIILLVGLGLGLGSTVTYADIRKCFQQKKLGLMIGTWLHLLILPIVALTYSKIFSIKGNLFIGLILMASAPGAALSNLVTYKSNGDVSLSIVMSGASTFLCFGALPLLVYIYLGLVQPENVNVKIPYKSIANSLLILILPCGLGVTIRTYRPEYAKVTEKVGSYVGVLFLLIYVIYEGATSRYLFTRGFGIWWSSITLQPVGTLLGSFVAHILSLEVKQQRALAIETGTLSPAVIITLIQLSFSTQDAEEISIPSVLYTISMVWNSYLIILVYNAIDRYYGKHTDPNSIEISDSSSPPEEKANQFYRKL